MISWFQAFAFKWVNSYCYNVCGHTVAANLRKVQRVLGYCPQFDPLLELMTGTETVEMYARLKVGLTLNPKP